MLIDFPRLNESTERLIHLGIFYFRHRRKFVVLEVHVGEPTRFCSFAVAAVV